MICQACREQHHDRCRAKGRDRSWCDCQHRKIDKVPPATGPVGD